MDIVQFDALTAGFVALFGLILSIWSFLIFLGNKKLYALLIGLLVFFFSLSYSVIPISFVYLENTGVELPLIWYMILGYMSLPIAVFIAVYMGSEIFFPKYKIHFLILFAILSLGFYIFLFGFPESNIIRHRPTKAEVVGIAMVFMSLLLLIAILLQVVGFYQLRKREETKAFHNKMNFLISGWIIMMIASTFDTIATEPWQLVISRGLTAFSLYCWYIGYSPENAVTASIEIDAPVDTVWKILIDLEKYPEWNPFTPRVQTSLKVGEEFTLDCQMNPKTLMKDVPEVMLDFDPSIYTIGWGSSRTKRKGVIGDRRQQLIPISENKTRYTAREVFTGSFAGLVMILYGRDLTEGFKKAATALKKRAETH